MLRKTKRDNSNNKTTILLPETKVTVPIWDSFCLFLDLTFVCGKIVLD